MSNHDWCEHGANIIFNTEIRCAVRKHKFTCKNMSKLRTIFPWCLSKNGQNLVCCVQLLQQCDMCSQSRSNRCTFSNNMFIACMWVALCTHSAPACTSLRLVTHNSQNKNKTRIRHKIQIVCSIVVQLWVKFFFT